MSVSVDSDRLDDVTAIAAADPGEMLRAVATSVAQVRSGATAATDAGVDRLAAQSRPRAVVLLGIGTSALAAQIFAALTGPTCPIPVVVCSGFGLPGWVGAADLVVAVSGSGRTPETLAATEEAARRGAEVVAVSAAGSPLADLAERARGMVVPVPGGQPSRAMLWALSTPLVVIGGSLGLLDLGGDVISATAERLYGLALRCQPSSESFLNPAKELALSLAGSLPMAWGTSPVTGLAADRLAGQWAQNAKAPAIAGALPSAAHDQMAVWDGSWSGSPADLFADPGDDAASPPRLHVVLLRDAVEHPQVAAAADVLQPLADQRGVKLTELRAEGGSPYERLASLIGLVDYASVYLAVLARVDPWPTPAIDALRASVQASVRAGLVAR